MSTRKVPSNEILYDLYVNNKKSAGFIAKKYNIKSRSNVLIQLKKMGIDIRKDKGKNHHNWKGGRIIKGNNYIGIWNPDHERSDKQGYVFEHTLVAEKKYGRLPNKNEVIHHIDFNKQNNDSNNLYLCSYVDHTKLHRSADKLIKILLEKNIIVFINGEYIFQ